MHRNGPGILGSPHYIWALAKPRPGAPKAISYQPWASDSMTDRVPRGSVAGCWGGHRDRRWQAACIPRRSTGLTKVRWVKLIEPWV